MNITRRRMVDLILKATPVAIAAHFGISVVTAADIRLELLKDTHITQVAMPGETFGDKQCIWYSVANVANVWAEELKRQNPDADIHELNRTCRVMARAVDQDLEMAGVESHDLKVMVEVPKFTWTRAPRHPGDFGHTPTRPFQIMAGVSQEVTLWSKRTKVGYIGQKLIVGEEVDLARRSLFGLKNAG